MSRNFRGSGNPHAVVDERMAHACRPQWEGGAVSGSSGNPESQAVDGVFGRYMCALTAVDYRAAHRVLDDAIEGGVPWARLVADVIAPAQREVGERWMSGALGVADEHAATAVAENVLAVMSPLSGSSSSSQPRVIMVCSEGEWHTFPLRLAAAVASRSSQIQLTMLGGSISGEHLRRFVRNAQPAAVALSTTLSVHLIGAARSIRAACEEGVPVVVGGAAWGEGQERARLLGANVHVPDPAQLATALASLEGPRDPDELPSIPEEALLLDKPPDDLLRLALRHQARNNDWIRSMSSAQEEQTVADLAWMARHAANAVVVDDPTIVGHLFDWLLRLLTPRGVPATAVLDSARYLAEAVQPVAPLAAQVLQEEAARAHQRFEAFGGGGDHD